MSDEHRADKSYKEKEALWNELYDVVKKHYKKGMSIGEVGNGLLYFTLDFLYRNTESEEEGDYVLRSVKEGVKEIGEFDLHRENNTLYRTVLENDIMQDKDSDGMAQA